jgi:sec-independent protein translocase protein TatA
MAWNDPLVWILIAVVVVFLFGANKIPQFARAIGQVRKDWEQSSKEFSNPSPDPLVQNATTTVQSSPLEAASSAVMNDNEAEDPLVVTARQEGIDTQGKTRDQIATELAWKLKHTPLK